MNINYTKNIFGSNDDLKLILLPIAKNDSLSNQVKFEYNFEYFQVNESSFKLKPSISSINLSILSKNK